MRGGDGTWPDFLQHHPELVRHYNTRSAQSTAHRELTGSEADPPGNRRTTRAIFRRNAGTDAVLATLLAVFRPSTAIIATIDTNLATPAADQAGTITSVCDKSKVMLLLRPPRGPPRLRR